MGRILSIDLAYTSYEKFGACRIDGVGRPPWRVEFLKPAALGLTGTPSPAACAEALARFCAGASIDILLLDGPQGWKDPRSVLRGSRDCERQLRCPAKTGIEGQVKPRNYRAFVEFSIAVFTTLVLRWGMSLIARSAARPRAGVLLVESFPHAAWKGIGLPALPAKHRATLEDIDRHAARLFGRLDIDPVPTSSHDDLQALAGGLAGPALAAIPPGERPARPRGCSLVGIDPIRSDRGYFLEGLIAVPAPFGEEGAG